MVDYNDVFAGIMYDTETAYGSGSTEASGLSLGRVTSFSSDLTDNKGRRLGIGEGRNDSAYTYGSFGVALSVEWEVLSFDITPARSNSLDFMKYAIGYTGGAGTSADPYTLIQADRTGYGATDMPTFSLWFKNEGGTTDDVDQFTGCFMDAVSLSCAVDGVLTASATITAQTVTSSNAIITAYQKDTRPNLKYQQGTFKWGQTPTQVARVQSASINWSNSNKPISEIGSRFLQGFTLGKLTVDWNITVLMTEELATTMRDDFYGSANTPVDGKDPVEATADNEISLEFAEGNATDDRVVAIELDQCCITSISKPVPYDGGNVVVTLSGWSKLAKGNEPIKYYVV